MHDVTMMIPEMISEPVWAISDDSVAHLVVHGPFIVAFCACLVAGLLSFASPCVIPLVPGYISYLASLVSTQENNIASDQDKYHDHDSSVDNVAHETTNDNHDIADTSNGTKERMDHLDHSFHRYLILLSALFFVIGYSCIFILGSATIFGLIDSISEHRDIIQKIGGLITIVMAAIFLGILPQYHYAIRYDIPRFLHPVGGLILGIVFGLSWTPCLGPALSGIISVLVGTQGITVFRGIVLMFAYCLGLGLPFLGAAYGSQYALRSISWLQKNIRKIHIFSGILLASVGFALITGTWNIFIASLRGLFFSDWQVPL